MDIRKVLAISLFVFSLSGEEGIFFGEFTRAGSSKKVNSLPPVQDQNQPNACDSSWAFAVAAAMATQFNARSTVSTPLISLSAEMLLSCASGGYSCNYGSSLMNMKLLLEKLKTFGVSDDSCTAYRASDRTSCSPQTRCRLCRPDEKDPELAVCRAADYHEYRLKSYEKLESNEEEKFADLRAKMINRLHSDGPVICRISHSHLLFEYRAKSLTEEYIESGDPEYETWVSVVGFVAEKWILQLSFGQNVGFNGFVSVSDSSGKGNPLGLKRDCYAITVDQDVRVRKNSDEDLTLTQLKQIYASDGLSPHSRFQGLRASALVKGVWNEGLSPTGSEAPIDWRDRDGVNQLTRVKNQHVPGVCGSSWALSAASMLSDRLKISRVSKGITFPEYTFSVQSAINCKKGGSCLGGDVSLFLENIASWKLPLETCQQYQARNFNDNSCPPEAVCKVTTPNSTFPVKDFVGITVPGFGKIRGARFIKAALEKGPVVCGLEVTTDFWKYAKSEGKELNIFSQEEDFFSKNHYVEIVGWGVQKGVEYWIVKNSWGREWGYDGFVYLKAGINILGVESFCIYADPELHEK